MTQSWHDLLFAHWPVDESVLRARVPASLPLDLYQGQAWIGVVPFRMTNVAPRGVPPLRPVSAFAELNVRTYVLIGGRPGVYFFSLDAASAVAVAAARVLLSLPYYIARMEVRAGDNSEIHYTNRRRSNWSPAAELRAHYKPAGPAFEASAGTIEHFLTERYCLYNVDRRSRVYRLEIHHLPWTLQPAEAVFQVNTMADAAGIRLPDMAPLLHFAKRQDAVAWAPQTVEA